MPTAEAVNSRSTVLVQYHAQHTAVELCVDFRSQEEFSCRPTPSTPATASSRSCAPEALPTLHSLPLVILKKWKQTPVYVFQGRAAQAVRSGAGSTENVKACSMCRGAFVFLR